MSIERVCPICAGVFSAETAVRKYCSLRCSGIAQKRVVAAKIAAARDTYERKCKHCQTPFVTHMVNKKCCSAACSYKNRSRAGIPAIQMKSRKCCNCKEEFFTKIHSQRFCSMFCRQEFNDIHESARRKRNGWDWADEAGEIA